MAISRRKALGILSGGAVLAANANATTNLTKNAPSVAIVGGGISGLSVAYNLIRCGYEGKQITVVEKTPTLGGNAATAEVILGTNYQGDGLLNDFVRFADLGVNDVNLQTYKKLKQAMIDIGYSIDENLQPLEDTVAHYTPDFSEVWTKDGYLTGQAEPYKGTRFDDRRDVVDTSDSLHHKNRELAHAEHTFMLRAAKDYNKDNHDRPHWNYTVEEYVIFFEKHRLVETGISKENLKLLTRLFLYPRISAMYFADDAGPQDMPMRGVMSYYMLQEGVTGTDIDTQIDLGLDRRYFTNGSQHWINALGTWLESQNVKIYRGFEATVRSNGDGKVIVDNVSKESQHLHPGVVVDQVVMAGHADHQLQSFTDDSLLTKKMRENLSAVQHSTSCAYAHTWNRLLPPNPAKWRTYNVMIRTPDPEKPGSREKTPYQMTYVQNRHRNDRKNQNYNRYGLPVYFVSLNPEWEIPKEYILRRTDKDKEEAMRQQAGYEHCTFEADAGLATATFRHIVMTKKLLAIQADLPNHQGENCVFFAGCWTNGAALHEECFEQAERVASAMLGNKEYECRGV